jgi:hypothetical protein
MIGDAVKLTKDGEYAKAYDKYADVLVRASKTFAMPDAKDDAKKWILSITQDYLLYVEEQPHKSDCRAAYSELGKLRDEITSLEITYQKTESSFDESGFIQAWKDLFYRDQRSMPEKAMKNAKTGFANHLSEVVVKNDISAPIEGVFYSPNLDRSTSFRLEKLAKAKGFFLESGPWVIVSRIPLDSMQEVDKSYFEQKGMKGRYAAHFFVLSKESGTVRLRLVLNDDSNEQ